MLFRLSSFTAQLWEEWSVAVGSGGQIVRDRIPAPWCPQYVILGTFFNLSSSVALLVKPEK